MKKLIMVTMIALTSLTSFGQTQKINGFGKLQLGMSVSDIPELSNATKMDNYDEYIRKVYKNRQNKNVYEQIADTTGKGYTRLGSYDTSVRVFTIPSYQITDNIELKLLELKFKDNKLYSIECDYDSKLKDGLTLKYGEPKIENEEKEQHYTNGYGAKITKIDQRFETSWNTNDVNTTCISVLYKYHNSKGEVNYITYIHLKNKTISLIVDNNEKIVQNRIDKRKEEKKKQELSGL
jgi:hypothetical protein